MWPATTPQCVHMAALGTTSTRSPARTRRGGAAEDSVPGPNSSKSRSAAQTGSHAARSLALDLGDEPPGASPSADALSDRKGPRWASAPACNLRPKASGMAVSDEADDLVELLQSFPLPPSGGETKPRWHAERIRARALARDPAASVLALLQDPLGHESVAKFRELGALLCPAKLSAVVAAELEALATADAAANKPRGAMGKVTGAVGWLGARFSAAVGTTLSPAPARDSGDASQGTQSTPLADAAGRRISGVLREQGDAADTALDLGEALSPCGTIGASYSGTGCGGAQGASWHLRASRHCIVLAPRAAVTDAVKLAVLPTPPAAATEASRSASERRLSSSAPGDSATTDAVSRRRATVDTPGAAAASRQPSAAGAAARGRAAAGDEAAAEPGAPAAPPRGADLGDAEVLFHPRLASEGLHDGSGEDEPLWGRCLPPCPLFQELTHSVTVSNHGRGRVQLTAMALALDPPSAGTIEASPRSFSLRAGESAPVRVRVCLTRPGVVATGLVIVEDAAAAAAGAPTSRGGGRTNRVPILFRARSAAPLFGSPLAAVPLEASVVGGLTFRVPRPLAACWARLAGGAPSLLAQRFLFRLSALPEDVRAAIAVLSAGSSTLLAGSHSDPAVTGAEALGPREPALADAHGDSTLTLLPDGEAWTAPPLVECSPPHAAATALKTYLREMPTRLLDSVPLPIIAAASAPWPSDLMDAAAGGTAADAARATPASSEEVAAAHAALLRALPLSRARILGWLAVALAQVAANRGLNDMSPQALGIVVGPNLRSPPDQADDGAPPGDSSAMVAASRALAEARMCGALMESMISHVLAAGELQPAPDGLPGVADAPGVSGVGFRACPGWLAPAVTPTPATD